MVWFAKVLATAISMLADSPFFHTVESVKLSFKPKSIETTSPDFQISITEVEEKILVWTLPNKKRSPEIQAGQVMLLTFFRYIYSNGPNHLKTVPFEIWTFLSIFQMVRLTDFRTPLYLKSNQEIRNALKIIIILLSISKKDSQPFHTFHRCQCLHLQEETSKH